MISPEERQPGLVTPEDSRVRMAGLENLVDTPQKRIRATVLTGLTGVLAMEAFSVAAQDEDDEEEPTATATATRNGNSGTATPEARTTEVAQVATPTPGETLVALAAPVSLETSLAGYPNTVRYETGWVGPVRFELNPNSLRSFPGVNGQMVNPGYYSERPTNLSAVFSGSNQSIEQEVSINGAIADYDYVVGWVTNITRLGEPNGPVQGMILHVTFPARYLDTNGIVTQETAGDRHYATVRFALYGHGDAIYAVDEQGQVIPGGRYNSDPYGSDPETMITLGSDEVLTYPSDEGIQYLRAGAPIVVNLLRNADEAGISNVNGGHTVDEVISSLMDSNPSNDIGYEFGTMQQPLPILHQQFIYALQDSQNQ